MDNYEEFYKKIGKAYCPYFREDVHFTNVGLDHIGFKNKYTARTTRDKSMRCRLLPVAVEILGQSHTLQGKTHRRRFEKRQVNSRVEIALVEVVYYEFIAVIGNDRVKVVIKQAEHDKEKVFLSVIPYFKQQKMPLDESDIL